VLGRGYEQKEKGKRGGEGNPSKGGRGNGEKRVVLVKGSFRLALTIQGEERGKKKKNRPIEEGKKGTAELSFYIFFPCSPSFRREEKEKKKKEFSCSLFSAGVGETRKRKKGGKREEKGSFIVCSCLNFARQGR